MGPFSVMLRAVRASTENCRIHALQPAVMIVTVDGRLITSLALVTMAS